MIPMSSIELPRKFRIFVKFNKNMLGYKTYPWSAVDSMEDPITGLMIDKDMFFDTYRVILESLDGQDPEFSVEHWFEPTPLNKTHLRFRSDERKAEWIEIAVDESCIPSMVEVCEGENTRDKLKRFGAKVVKTPKAPKPERSNTVADQVQKINNVLQTIEQLKRKLATNPSTAVQNKLERAYLVLNKLTNTTV